MFILEEVDVFKDFFINISFFGMLVLKLLVVLLNGVLEIKQPKKG